MQKDTNKIINNQPEPMSVEQLVKTGAQKMLSCALEAEIKAYLERHHDLKTPDGNQAVVRRLHRAISHFQ